MILSGAMVCCGVRICYDSVPPGLSCGSETLFACFAQLDLPAPFGFEDLRRSYAAGRVRIENRVDDITAASLHYTG
jgi:hypothetical protein